MGFLARFAIAVGIVYWLAPEPAGYRMAYETQREQERAAAALSALMGLNERADASRDDIEALAVKAGQALAALDPQARRALVERYFGSGAETPISEAATLKRILN